MKKKKKVKKKSLIVTDELDMFAKYGVKTIEIGKSKVIIVKKKS